MTSTSSDLAVSSADALQHARGQVTLAGFLSGARQADSRSFALPAVRHSSMTRAGLDALERVHDAIRASHA